MVQPDAVAVTAVTMATWVRSPFSFCLLRPPHMELMSPALGRLMLPDAAEPDAVAGRANEALASATKLPATSLSNRVWPVTAYRKRFASSVGWNPAKESNGVLPAVLLLLWHA